MHIPIKVDYGVRALVDLALHGDKGPVRTADIAGRTVIPEQYLAQVMLALGKSGLVRSQRGPQGGHALAMDPSEIRLSMVMACLGGEETLVGCLGDTSACIHVPSCAQREVWQSVEQAVFKLLDEATVGDLAERTRALKSGRDRSGSVQPLSAAPV